MSKKRTPKGQRSLLSPEEEAITELGEELTIPVLSQVVICPFCAYKGPAIEFRAKKSEKSDRYSSKIFRCPDCNERMRRDTLLGDMTVSEWARWLYFDQIPYGGYERISWEKLSARLKQYGWASEFWSAWRAAKEGRKVSDIEDYTDYLRKGAEESRNGCSNYEKGIAGRSSMVCTTCESYLRCWPKELKV